jgi:hypothetical protein
MPLQDEKEDSRRRYMTDEITHQQHYQWLAERIGLTPAIVANWIGAERILASTDPHLNDIPLHRWDNYHQTVLGFAKSRAGGRFIWSLSDSVCCLKALARRYQLEHPTK